MFRSHRLFKITTSHLPGHDKGLQKNMQLTRHFLFIAILIVFCHSSQAKNFLGLAQYSEIKSPIYIASLSLIQAPRSSSHAQSMLGQKIMRFHIQKSGYPIRSFTRHLGSWAVKGNANIEGVEKSSINAIYQLQGELRKKLQRPYLKPGDIFSIYLKDERVLVSINDLIVFEKQDAGLGAYLLNIWLGAPPADEDFYQAISQGKAAKGNYPELLTELAKLNPSFDQNNLSFNDAIITLAKSKTKHKASAAQQAQQHSEQEAKLAKMREQQRLIEEKNKRKEAEQLAATLAEEKAKAKAEAQRLANEAEEKAQREKALAEKAERLAAELAAEKAKAQAQAKLLAEEQAREKQLLEAQAKRLEAELAAEKAKADAQAKAQALQLAKAQAHSSKTNTQDKTTQAPSQQASHDKKEERLSNTYAKPEQTSAELVEQKQLIHTATTKLKKALNDSPIKIDYKNLGPAVIFISHQGVVYSGAFSLSNKNAAASIGKRERQVLKRAALAISPLPITQSMLAQEGLYTLNIELAN